MSFVKSCKKLLERTVCLIFCSIRKCIFSPPCIRSSSKIPTASINLHSRIQNEILFYQIVQKEFGRLLIKVLPKSNSTFSASEIQKVLENEMKKNLQDFDVIVKIVRDSEIQRSVRGKMIMLVQELIF